MSADAKATFKNAKAIAMLKAALGSGTPNAAGLPNGTRVVTNSAAVTRFPLPLSLTSAAILAVGFLAMMRGHRVIGLVLLTGGGIGLGAAAAAPEMNALLTKAAQ